jgi:hypothetical protein
MRHTQVVLAASVAGTLTLLACRDSENPSTPNPEPALLEAANFTCVGGSANDPLYAERRVYLESQGWWGERRTDGTVPQYGNAEHIHVAMCFPLKQTVSGTRRFVVRVQGHRMKVNSKITSTSLHDPAQGNGEGIGLASITWNRVIRDVDNGTFDSTVIRDVDTRKMPNGLREFRNLTKVERVGGDEIHASSGWCWNVNNSSSLSTDPPGPSGTCATAPNQTSGRGWYSCFEYKIAEVRNWAAETAPATLYPFGGIQRSSDYILTIGARDGAGQLGHTDFDRWEVRLDPDFHALDRGDLIDSGTGPANGETVTIDGTLLTGPKVHKLVVLGFSNDDCSTAQKGEMAAVFAVPLKVN